MSHLADFKWNIVEQQHFVDCGKKDFEDEHLKFYHTIEECLELQNSDTILFSSVLQYLEEPYALLEQVKKLNFKYIIIDITGFINENQDRITIQKVPGNIYNASYPSWFFNKEKLYDFFSDKYDLVFDFPGYVGQILNIDNQPVAGYRGAFFKMKS